MKAFKEMFIANCKEYIRDGGLIFISILFPVILAVIFGIVFKDNSKDEPSLKIGIINGEGQIYDKILEQYGSNNKIFEGSEEIELEALEKGKRDIVFKLPGTQYQDTNDYSIEVLYDNTNDDISDSLLSNMRQSFIDIEDSVTGNARKVSILFNGINELEKTSTFSYIFPGILALTLMQLGLYSSLEYLKLRDNKVMRSLAVTPLSRSKYLGSDLLLRVVIGYVQAIILLSIGYFIFGLEIKGSLLSLSALILLGSLTFSSIGYLLVNASKSTMAGNILVQIVMMVMIFLSGIFFKTSSMPGYLQQVMKVLPLTYLGDAIRQVMLGISGEYSMFMNVTVLLASLLVSALLTVKLWKWE